MANSSDWLGVLTAPETQAAQPGWMSLLGEPEGFREAFPFGTLESRAAAPELSVSAPDPTEAAITRAFAEGQAAGRAAAEAEIQAAATRQRALRLSFRALDEAARDVLADDLAATVMALCDGALAGCAVNREALLARCHAAAQRIGGAADTLTLHLHPDDIASLEAAALAGWKLAPDPALERGSVLIESADGAVTDGPAEWRRAIAAGLRG